MCEHLLMATTHQSHSLPAEHSTPRAYNTFINIHSITHKKGKAGRAPPERRQRAHLPVKAVEPVGGWTTESVTHGQCDARPTVTYPVAERRRPLAGTKLYCLVTEAHGCEQLAQSCYSVADLSITSQRPNH